MIIVINRNKHIVHLSRSKKKLTTKIIKNTPHLNSQKFVVKKQTL